MVAPSLRALALVAGTCVFARLLPVLLRLHDVDRAHVELASAPQFQDVPTAMVYYCGSCHRAGRSGMNLDIARDIIVRQRDRSVWRNAVEYLRNGDMPPAGKPQPSQRERELLIDWIEKGLAAAEDQANAPLVFRRLTREEYGNAVRDLLGVRFQPSAGFPADDAGWSASGMMPHLSAADHDQYLATARQLLVSLPAANSQVSTWDEVRETVVDLAERAFRRPRGHADVMQLLTDVHARQARGEPAAKAMNAALLDMLTSPRFLFIVEARNRWLGDGQAAPLDDFDLAGRLAFFLWKSVPDSRLLCAARLKMLPAEVDAQVARMLQDRRAEALVEGFTNYWLELDKLQRTRLRVPALATSMRRETQLFFSHVMRADRSVLDFLDADYTFLDERLARHYGIAGVKGDSPKRVALAGIRPGGLLFHASVLTLTSSTGETSPVKRGKWVLDNLLNDPPGPPPPEAARLAKSPISFPSGTLRQHMERHRADAACVQCHARIDALGLALESFNELGAWRTRDGAFPVDAVGDLPDGGTLQGPDGLRAYLRTKQLDFVRCLAAKLLAFALSRTLEGRDQDAVREIASRAAENDYRFSRLIAALVDSAPFHGRFPQSGDRH